MVGGNSLVCIYENYFHTWKQMCAVIIIATVMRIFMNILLVCKMLVWGQMGFKQKLFRPVVIYWWSEPCESDGGQHCHRVLIKTSLYWNMWQHISPGYKKTSKLVQTAAKHSNCSNEKKKTKVKIVGIVASLELLSINEKNKIIESCQCFSFSLLLHHLSVLNHRIS